MALRRASCYARVKRAYTRHSRVKNKDYVKAIPSNKIARYDMGDPTKKYQYRVDLICQHPQQIRHNAIESARMVANRILHNNAGMNYFFKVRQYPHQILRENKMITGAGADRMQTGMALSFGRSMGIAIQLKRGTILFSAFVNKEHVPIAKESMRRSHSKLPGRFLVNAVELK